MIILDGQDEGKPLEILIDLDSAIELAEGLEIKLSITGTRPFMAIGVLKSEMSQLSSRPTVLPLRFPLDSYNEPRGESRRDKQASTME